MLLVLQFPLADLRLLGAQGSERILPRPNWRLPEPDIEFVRCFGLVRRRLRGVSEIRGLDDEAFYCDARRAIKLDRLGTLFRGARSSCAFRRLFYDGQAAARVEVGVHVRTTQPVQGHDTILLVRGFLDLPSLVAQYRGNPVGSPLLLQGKALARLFHDVRAAGIPSTVDSHALSVLSCQPTILVECDDREMPSVPDGFQRIDTGKGAGAELAHSRLQYRGRTLGLWLLKCTAGGMSRASASIHLEAARKVRLCVLRLHAEREVLTQVLRGIARGQIVYAPKTAAGECLEQYLNDATRALSRPHRFGVDQQAVQAVVNAYTTIITSPERALLLEQLQRARRQIREKTARLTDRPMGRQPDGTPVIYHAEQVNVYEIHGSFHGDTYMAAKTSITFGDNNTFHGDVVAAGNIEHSFNKAAEVEKDDLQTALKQLTTSVAALCEQLAEPEDQQRVSRRLKSFVEEASASSPDKGFLEVTGQGLVEAAKTAAQMVVPITAAVKGVLALFGASLP